MAKNVAINVNVNTNFDQVDQDIESIINSTKTLKQQFKELSLAAATATDPEVMTKYARAAGELKDKIGDANNQIKQFSSDTKGLDVAVSSIQGIAGAFAAVQGAQALLGTENEKVEKSIQKLMATMTLLNGIQQVSKTLNKDETVGKYLHAAANKVLNSSLLSASKGLKIFKLALVGTGVGAIVVALGALIANFDTVKKTVLRLVPGLEKVGGLFKRIGEWLGIINDKAEKTPKELDRIYSVIYANQETFNETMDEGYQKDRNNLILQFQKKYDAAQKNGEDTEILNEWFRKKDLELQKKWDKIDFDRWDTANQNRINALIEANDIFRESMMDARETELYNEERDYQIKLEKLKNANLDTTALTEKHNERIAEIEEKYREKDLDNTKEYYDRRLKEVEDYYNNLRELIKVNETRLSIDGGIFGIGLPGTGAGGKGDLKKGVMEIAGLRLLFLDKERRALLDNYNINQRIYELTKLEIGAKEALLKQRLREGGLNDTETKEIQSQLEDLTISYKALGKEQKKATLDFIKDFQAAVDITASSSFNTLNNLKLDEMELLKQLRDNDLISESEYYKAKDDLDKFYSQKKWERTANLIDAIGGLTRDSLSVLSDLNEAAEKSGKVTAKKAFERNKKISIAEAIISSLQAAATTLSSAAANPSSVLFPAYPYIQAGLILASGYGKVKKIQSTTFDSGSTAGSTSTPAANVYSPIANPFIGQGASQIITPDTTKTPQYQTMRVWVAETDITSTQNKVKVIEKNANAPF